MAQTTNRPVAVPAELRRIPAAGPAPERITAAAPVRPPVPRTLHVGSGKKWCPESLNLDVEPRWRGIGIRIEDDVVVTKEGCRNLTEGVPTTIADIEALMAD